MRIWWMYRLEWAERIRLCFGGIMRFSIGRVWRWNSVHRDSERRNHLLNEWGAGLCHGKLSNEC
jgi:hypothetical protein